MNVSKNQVVCAKCHLVGLASGIDWINWSSAESGAASASVWRRTAEKLSSNCSPFADCWLDRAMVAKAASLVHQPAHAAPHHLQAEAVHKMGCQPIQMGRSRI